jgi:hypothetical protein
MPALRAPLRRTGLLAGLALSLLASGSALRAPAGAAAPSPARRHVDCAGKPLPAIGAVEARIVARPAPDRAVVEADWRRGPTGEGCCLTLVLPEGAFLVDGEGDVPMKPGEDRGTTTWQVQFPLGAPSDLVLRLYATTERGPCSRETALRLTD